jgi:hypothetical protein
MVFYGCHPSDRCSSVFISGSPFHTFDLEATSGTTDVAIRNDQEPIRVDGYAFVVLFLNRTEF